MDIQGWLQETADRAPPNPSDEVDAPAVGRHTQGGEATTAICYRRKRRRTGSESSIIAPQRRTDYRSKAEDRSAYAARDRSADGLVSGSLSASRHRRPRSQERDMNSRIKQPEPKTYERRARHKTKADRYEPKKQDTKGRKQRDDADERKSKRKGSRARRGGDGKRTESLVQGFRLKNGPSNSRLTLKPDNTAGFFKHGRASAQMAGRRNGLPDLAFNELKFLRDPEEHQDERRPDDANRKPSNQERKRETEREEISAYFHQRTSRDHALDPALGNHRATKQGPPIEHDEHDDNYGGSSPILPDEELPAIPYRGFGSKGTVNQSSNHHPSATTYLTWSESAANPDTRAERMPDLENALEVDQASAAKGLHIQQSKDHQRTRPADTNAERSARKRQSEIQRGHWSASRRIRGPAKVEVYIQPDDAGQSPLKSKQDAQDSASLSLPTRPPPRSTRDWQQKPVHRQECLHSNDGSFHTSDILKVRGRLEALAEEAPLSAQSVHVPRSDKENAQPISSSPTAKILRIAHDAMAKTHREPASRPSRNMHQPSYCTAVSEQQPPSRAVPNPRHEAIQNHLRDPTNDELTYRSVYVSPAVRAHYFHQQVQQNEEVISAAVFDQEDDEMLDGYNTFEPQIDDNAHPVTDEGFPYTYAPPASHLDGRSLSHQHDRPSTRARGVPWSRGDVSTPLRGTSSHIIPAERGSSVEIDRIGGREFEDGLEGFWKPNRLY